MLGEGQWKVLEKWLQAAQGIEGVYLLSGDLHAAHAIRAELDGPQGRSLPLREFGASPFEQAPNRFASLSYAPLRTRPVKHQQLFFCARQPNFGVVRVDFSAPGRPEVRFEVYGETGEVLGEVRD